MADIATNEYRQLKRTSALFKYCIPAVEFAGYYYALRYKRHIIIDSALYLTVTAIKTYIADSVTMRYLNMELAIIHRDDLPLSVVSPYSPGAAAVTMTAIPDNEQFIEICDRVIMRNCIEYPYLAMQYYRYNLQHQHEAAVESMLQFRTRAIRYGLLTVLGLAGFFAITRKRIPISQWVIPAAGSVLFMLATRTIDNYNAYSKLRNANTL